MILYKRKLPINYERQWNWILIFTGGVYFTANTKQ